MIFMFWLTLLVMATTYGLKGFWVRKNRASWGAMVGLLTFAMGLVGLLGQLGVIK